MKKKYIYIYIYISRISIYMIRERLTRFARSPKSNGSSHCVGQWRPNAAASCRAVAATPCRAVAAERGRAMSGGGGRTRPRYVGRWRPNAAAPCRAVAAERGRVMSGGGGRARPHHVGLPNGPRYISTAKYSRKHEKARCNQPRRNCVSPGQE